MAPRFVTARVRSILRLLGLVLFVYLSAGCRVSFEAPPVPTFPVSAPLSPRVPGESTLDLIEQWRFHTGRANAGFSSSPPNLYMTGDKILLSYWVGETNGDGSLVALSLETGQVIWKTRLTNRWDDTYVSSSYLDKERLYLVYAFRINAFSLETGELLWSEYPGEEVPYFFRPWDPDNPLLVHSSEDEAITLNPQTGDILHRQPEEDAWSNIPKAQVQFVLDVTGFYVIDRQTGQVLWARPGKPPYRPELQLWPVFIEEDIVFEFGRVCYDIVRANVQTGQVVWETTGRDYLSQNFAIAGTRLYALREDLTLVAFDLETGAEIGTLKFDGPPAATDCDKGGSDVYWVTADGPYVAVYFGDSREVILFKEQITP